MKNLIYEEYSNNTDENGDLIYPLKNTIGGTLVKRFIRADSKYFKELFNELRKNPNCSYSTYLNDLVRDSDISKSKLPVQSVSTLFKPNRNNDNALFYSELASTRVANYFEVPTAFNSSYENNYGERYILSVDFISPDEVFVPLSHLTDKVSIELSHNLLSHDFDLKYWIETLEKSIEKFPLYNYNEKCKEQLLKDFVSAYLVRALILEDYDFHSQNFGILVNKKTRDYRLAPLFDMDHCFCKGKSTMYFNMACEMDLKYAHQYFPEETKHFKEKINELTDEKLEDIISPVIPDKDILTLFYKITNRNINIIKHYLDYPMGYEFESNNIKKELDYLSVDNLDNYEPLNDNNDTIKEKQTGKVY